MPGRDLDKARSEPASSGGSDKRRASTGVISCIGLPGNDASWSRKALHWGCNGMGVLAGTL